MTDYHARKQRTRSRAEAWRRDTRQGIRTHDQQIEQIRIIRAAARCGLLSEVDDIRRRST